MWKSNLFSVADPRGGGQGVHDNSLKLPTFSIGGNIPMNFWNNVLESIKRTYSSDYLPTRNILHNKLLPLQ